MTYEDPKMDTSNISWRAKDSVGLQKKSMSYEIYDYKDHNLKKLTKLLKFVLGMPKETEIPRFGIWKMLQLTCNGNVRL